MNSRILADLFEKCLNECYFPDCRKVFSVAPVSKNVDERPKAKNYRTVSLLVVANKVSKKHVNWGRLNGELR